MIHALKWIKKSSQKNIFEHSLDHLQKVKETVEALFAALQSLPDRGRMKELLHVVAQKEHEADNIRKHLTLEIVKGNLIFVGYEDLLEFVYSSDSIADYAHTADRYLALFEGKFSDEIITKLLRLTELGCKSVNKLYHVVETLAGTSKEDVLAGCAEIETLEEVADDEKREILRIIFHSNYSAAELIILRDLVEAVEDICDRCEIAADKVRLLAVQKE